MSDDLVVAEVARQVGIGQKTLESRDRTGPNHAKRAVVVWILTAEHRWTASRIAQHLNRSERQVRRLLKSTP